MKRPRARCRPAVGGSFSNAGAQKFIAAVAKDLQAHRGRSLVIAGDYQPAAVHHLAHQLNQSLGNIGTTVTYAPTIEVNSMDQVASLRDLAAAMDAGQVDLLVILGSNPVFTAPADLKFQERLAKVQLTVSHSLYPDETSRYCQWNLPEAHALESWGDARAYDGTVTVMQPLIAPLYLGRTTAEVLGHFIDAQIGKSAHDLVKDYWTRAQAGTVGSYTITDATGQPFKSADSFWKHVLHDGWVPGTAAGAAAVAARPQLPALSLRLPAITLELCLAGASGGLEIIFRPDPTIWDGRFANNGWLQELPKPLTKITWDPTAWVSPQLAQQQGLRDGDIIELEVPRQYREAAGDDRAGASRRRRHRVLRLRPPASRDGSARRPTPWRRTSTSIACARPMRCGSAAGSRSPRPATAT